MSNNFRLAKYKSETAEISQRVYQNNVGRQCGQVSDCYFTLIKMDNGVLYLEGDSCANIVINRGRLYRNDVNIAECSNVDIVYYNNVRIK